MWSKFDPCDLNDVRKILRAKEAKEIIAKIRVGGDCVAACEMLDGIMDILIDGVDDVETMEKVMLAGHRVYYGRD